MLQAGLERLTREFVYERGKPYGGSEFANWVRHDLAIEAKKRLLFLPYDLIVKASVGSGNWAAVPWVAFFDPLITSSATRGFYVVYLVNAQNHTFYLSMNQATTEVFNEFGEKRGEDVLRRRAIDIRERVADYAKSFSSDPIDLGSEDRLPRGYGAGHSFGRKYSISRLDPGSFESDLEQMLAAYKALVDRGGTLPSDAMQEEANGATIEETRRYILSRRIERAPAVRVRVLEKRGARCEGCGLDPKAFYSFSGPLKNTPLDVHHRTAIRELAEGESRRYRIPEDFLVLCPSCHRVIHQQTDPSDLDSLRSKLQKT